MKISILTVAFNSASTLVDTINSVRSQDYPHIEYIVVDGNSSDGTVEIIHAHASKIDRWISEPDQGIYDAMNKALKLATGEVIGILNSDDFYTDSTIVSKVAKEFVDPSVDVVFGDLVFVDPQNLSKVVRTYSAAHWYPKKLAWGFMPPHPAVFIRKKYYEQFGVFKTDYKIAADYELLIRFLYVHQLKYKYLPMKMVVMRKGGVSSRNWRSNIILNDEIMRGCRENGLYTNWLMVYSKYFRKWMELVN
ncbi:MAG TPA: glycosyl transferase [Cytophagales bacterium]|nr:glycosyl transferase [Cytophagales bacterium]